MPGVTVILHEGLQDLLPRAPRGPLSVSAPWGATALAIIEDLGIPHTEVGTLSVNGRAVASSYRPLDGDRIAVHRLRPGLAGDATPPRFVLDVHLGKLARLLRLLGFDAAWSSDADDAQLAATASRERRILLSRDRGLLKRREVRKGCLLRSQDARRQLDEVVARYGLRPLLAPFSRCLMCNGLLARDPPSPGTGMDVTGACPSCGRRYWRGSHWRSLSALVEEIRCGAARVIL